MACLSELCVVAGYAWALGRASGHMLFQAVFSAKGPAAFGALELLLAMMDCLYVSV